MNRRKAILDAIEEGNNRTRDISAATGIPREIVQVRIAELLRYNVVSAFRTLAGNKHGNEKWYRVRQ